MTRIQSYLCGRFVEGAGEPAVLFNPATEEPLCELAPTAGLGDAVAFARRAGGPALRALTFAARGALLGRMSKLIYQHRDELLDIGMRSGGNTRGDAKFDVDGASGTLQFYAELGAALGEARALVDGDGVQLGRSPRVYGRHVRVARAGVAVHINAFNFPAWGAMEKAAVALLAGMPVISKPATSTAVLAHRICQILVEGDVLPPGAFQLLLGPVGDLLDHLEGQDVLAFTGSGDTGARLRGDARLVAHNVRVNVEADSLNAAILGADVAAGSDTYNMFLADVARDMTQKAGQKCTAIRRVLVPTAIADRAQEDLIERLSAVKIGDPFAAGVTMGPLATARQLADVRAGLAKLAAEGRTVHGGDGSVTPIGVPAGKGYFLGPVLLRQDAPAAARTVHALEVFGPIATLMPFDGGAAAAVDLVQRGAGGLVSSAYSDDRDYLAELVAGIAPFHGRLYLGSEKVADKMAGPGTVLPHLVHGGPGRAGAGEELGGRCGMELYMQRTALQGDRSILDALVKAL